MRALIGVVRLALALLAVVAGAVLCALAGALGCRLFGALAMRWQRLMLGALGVRSRARGTLAPGALLLSNHISWLDTLLFGARWPVIFLARRDIARWPVLGWGVATAGTLFIERGSGAAQAITDIGAALRRGRNVALFPEGMTTDGRSVIRFQPRLLQAAIDAGAPVQPAAVRYVDAAGRRATHHSFAGDVTFAQSVWRTVSGPPLTADITLFAPLPPGDERQTLANQVEQQVKSWVESGGEMPLNPDKSA